PERLTVQGPARELTHGAQEVFSGAPSPDGRWIAFDNWVPHEDLFLMSAEGGIPRQLTNDRFKDRHPQWSPDGKSLLFYSNRSGHYEAWTIRPDGSGLRQVTKTTGGSLTYPIWSPDGRRLACSLDARGAALVDLDERVDLHSAHLLAMAGRLFLSPTSWSPDGSKLAGNLNRQDGTRAGDGIGLYSFSSRTAEILLDRGSLPLWLHANPTLPYLDPCQ